MFKLNHKIEYALIALKHMNAKRPGELTSAKEVAETYNSSFDVIARVMKTLAQNGILRAEQGAHGGYQILKDLSKVSLYELGVLLMGPVRLVKCLNSQMPCENEKSCNVMSPLTHLNSRLEGFYQSISILELINSSEGMSTKNKSLKSKVEFNEAGL